MFWLEIVDKDTMRLNVELPQGKTQHELVDATKKWIAENAKDFFGKHVQIYGRITTAMALTMGHELAHITKSVSVFDPKLNQYVKCIWH